MIHIKTVIREVEGKKLFAKELLLDGQHSIVIMQKDVETPSTIFHQKLIKLFDLGKITYVFYTGNNNFLKETGEQGSLTFEKDDLQIEGNETCFYLSSTEIEDGLYEETKLPIRVLESVDDFLILNWR